MKKRYKLIMRSPLWRSSLLGLVLCLPRLLAAADYPTNPKAVLEKFLALDADAAGVSTETWPELGRYTTWPEAPAWDSMTVIESYTVGKVLQGTTRAQAPVTYQPLGQLSDRFMADTKPETVVFYLNKVEGQWKVDGPQAPPHVAYDVIRKRLAVASVATPKMKPVNDALLAQIQSTLMQLDRGRQLHRD